MDKNEYIQLSGTVEVVVFSSEDTGFTVLELDADGEQTTVVGTLPGVAPGEEVQLTGNYTTHPTYGRQFQAELCERTLPATASAILKYLSSGAIKGVGPRTARRLVDAFGDDTLEIIEKSPEKLAELPRISLRAALNIQEEYKRIFGIRSVMLTLSKYGIEASQAILVWKEWGIQSVEMVEENPYLLCAPHIGVPFEVADEIGKKLQLGEDSPLRIRAGIIHVLTENEYNGHTCLPADQLVATTTGLLGIPQYHVEDVLQDCVEENYFISSEVRGRRFIYLPELYQAETYIAGRLHLLIQMQHHETEDYQRDIDRLEQQLDIVYAANQRRAIAMAMEQNVFILTGGPGTGKTTTLNGILTLLEEREEKVALAAPTGRAAQRMTEVTGREAKTIHRLLEVDFRTPGQSGITFKRNEKNPLRYNAIILDEVSMIDTRLLAALIQATSLGCRLILVGDPDQLPSVGAGNILGDLIDSDVVPTVHLNEIFRQARQSQIVIASHEIVKGDYPNLGIRDNDFFFLREESYESTMITTMDLCKRRLPKAYGYSSLWDIQVISPSRVGALGTVELNRQLQQHLNPPSSMLAQQRFGAVTFREQDKVMHIKNNYDILWRRDDGEEGTGVFNGDIGVIELIDRPSQTLLIRYDDRVAEYTFDMMKEIEHAYAITVHKSQGSEFPAVVMPLMSFHPKLYYRNILYTGVTRAKELMILLGQEQTIGRMIENNRKVLRYTNLATYLEENVLG